MARKDDNPRSRCSHELRYRGSQELVHARLNHIVGVPTDEEALARLLRAVPQYVDSIAAIVQADVDDQARAVHRV